MMLDIPNLFPSGAWRPRAGGAALWPSVLLLTVLLLAAAAAPGHAQQNGAGAPPTEAIHLVGASSNNFPPINVLDADGALTGFGREFAEAVAGAVGATVTHVHSGVWTEVLDWLASGEADFIHDTGYSEERTSYLEYTAPILEMPERIFVLADRSDLESFADLAGRKVACVDQHVTHLYLKQFPEIDCLIVKRPVEGLYALVEGEADAFIYPKQIALYLAHNTRLRNRIKMVGEPLRTLTWHMVVKKGNTALVALLDRGIAKVRASGQYDRIYARWFGEPLLAGYTQREVYLLVGAAIGLSLLVAGAVFALFFLGRMRGAAKIEQRPIEPISIVFAAVMMVAIFLVDLSLPLGVAGGVPYVAVVLLGWWLDRPRLIFSLAVVGSLLTMAGYFLSPEGGTPWMVVTNRFLALSAIWITALLLARAKHAEAALRYAHGHLERQIEVRTRDLRTANEALRESEERSRATFEQAAVGICHTDRDGRFLRVNQKLCEIAGYSRDELLEKTFHDITHPDDRDADRRNVDRALEGDISAYSAEKRYFRKDGSTVWINVTVSLVRCASGEPNYFIAIFEDITDRKRADKALVESEASLAKAQKIAQLGNWDHDLTTDELYWSQEVFRIFCFEREAFDGTTASFYDRVHPDDRARVRQATHAAIYEGKPFNFDHRIVLPDGEVRVVHEQAEVEFDGGGQPIRVSGTVQDITERKRADEALRASEARLAGLLDIAPEAVISIDVSGRIQLFNQGAEAIFGYRGKEIMGQPLEKLLPPRFRGHHAKFIEGFAHAPEASRQMGSRREIGALRKDGTEFPAEGSISKLGDGEDMLFTVVLRDLTEQRLAEENERQLRAQLAHAGRLSTVGNMATGLAHEINQPLSAIGSYVQASIRLLRSGRKSTEDVIDGLEKANQQVTRAADIVKWLRATVTKEETEKTELDLNVCIREVANFLESEFRAKNCTLVVDLAEALPAVKADKVQIQQVILNLMQNSMEAADQSAPTRYLLEVRTSTSPDGTVQVAVEDSGPGIAPEILGEVFSPFVTTKSDGLGFGLSISKSIIEAHGGRIWAVSDVGHGATFTFTLPPATLPAAALATTALPTAGKASP